jgi:glycosyltransferase involved in cell wall biosynthesis
VIRILHVISSLHVGGAEHALESLVGHLDPGRFWNGVVCLIPTGEVGERMAAHGVPVESLEMRRGRPNAAAVWRLSRIVRRDAPDVVQSWLYHADLLSLVATALTGRRALAWNVRSSNMDMSRYRRLSGWTVGACARLSRFPAVVVVNSEAGRAYHESKGYHPRRWEVIPNGVDTGRFHPDEAARAELRGELGVSGGARLVGFVGRFDPMKDHATFLAAARMIAERDRGVHFVMTGDGVTLANPALSSLVTGPLVERAHLLGRRLDVPRLLASLDVLASSSSSEGFPTAVAEAMSCGIPCVVTNVGDAARVVGDTGVVVPPSDPDALADGLEELLARGVETRRGLGVRARFRVQREFSLDRMVESYERLYSSLADTPSAGAGRSHARNRQGEGPGA